MVVRPVFNPDFSKWCYNALPSPNLTTQEFRGIRFQLRHLTLQPPTYAGLLQKHYSLLRKHPVPRKFGNWNGKRRRLSDCQHPRWAVDTHSCREKKVWVSVVSGLALSPTVCSDPSVTASPASERRRYANRQILPDPADSDNSNSFHWHVKETLPYPWQGRPFAENYYHQ